MGGQVGVGDGVGVGGGRVATGVSVGSGEGEGVTLGVLDGERVGLDVSCGVAVVEGASATGLSVGDPQAPRLQLVQSSARSSSTAGRRIYILSLQHNVEKVAKQPTCQIVVFTVASGHDFLDVPAILG
jgi:hypothetical protein